MTFADPESLVWRVVDWALFAPVPLFALMGMKLAGEI
jgi:hypothetical protein